MADQQPTAPYYKVRVSTPFSAANVIFIPGRDYWVTAEIYNSTLEDNATFASKCAKATPEQALQ